MSGGDLPRLRVLPEKSSQLIDVLGGPLRTPAIDYWPQPGVPVNFATVYRL